MFDFNFLTSEGTCCVPDSAFVTLSVGSSVTAILLADSFNQGIAVIDPTFPQVTIFTNGPFFDPAPLLANGATGYTSFSLPVLESGQVTLAFAVLNATDEEVASALLIDNVRVVPEPTTLLLLGLGLVGLGYTRRRLH